MEWFVKAFLKASITWLALGVTLGVAMAVHSQLIVYRPAHVHMNLLGFVTMMIYGVASLLANYKSLNDNWLAVASIVA